MGTPRHNAETGRDTLGTDAMPLFRETFPSLLLIILSDREPFRHLPQILTPPCRDASWSPKNEHPKEVQARFGLQSVSQYILERFCDRKSRIQSSRILTLWFIGISEFNEPYCIVCYVPLLVDRQAENMKLAGKSL